MTCIAAVEDKDCVWLCADTAISNDATTDRVSEKIWIDKKTGIGFGVAGIFREAQLIRYSLKIPARRKSNAAPMMWLVNSLVPAIKEALSDSPTDEDGQHGIEMLIAIDGKIFCVDPALSVIQCTRGYMAAGTGEEIASGSLFSTKKKRARDRAILAVQAACAHSTSCALPLEVLKVESRKGGAT